MHDINEFIKQLKLTIASNKRRIKENPVVINCLFCDLDIVFKGNKSKEEAK